MKHYYILKADKLRLIFLSILFSFHIFFWDMKFINNYGLREAIALVNFYLVYDLIKNDFLILKKNIKNIIYIFLVILFFSIHLIINNKFDNRVLHIQSVQGLIGFSSLLFIIFFYYDFIKDNINGFIKIFLTLFLISYLFSDFTKSNYGDISTLCASYFKITNKIIFKENSHLAMVFTSCIGYLIVKNKHKSFLFHSFLLLPLLLISYFQTSATFYVSLVILVILILILEFDFFKKKFIFFILIFGLVSFIVSLIDNNFKTYKFGCSNKISESSLSLGKYFYNKLPVFESKDGFASNTLKSNKIRKFENEKKNKTVYELFPNQKINKNIIYPDLPRQKSKFTFNLSTAVLINSLNIALETLKNRPLGWGLNRYEYAFDYYMFSNIIVPYWYHEVYTLNFNDGSANIPKLVTEFGLFVFFIIPFGFWFLFTRKINSELKVFFLVTIFTQLVRGAGFFNGGFMFSLIFMIFTVLKFFKKND